MKIKMITALAALLAGIGTALPATAAEGVLRVLVVQPNDLSAYVHEVETVQAMYRKAGINVTLRVWRATYAGPDTGTIVVGIQAADLGVLARMPETLKSNPELAAEMKKVTAMRKVVSDSLYEPLSD